MKIKRNLNWCLLLIRNAFFATEQHPVKTWGNKREPLGIRFVFDIYELLGTVVG